MKLKAKRKYGMIMLSRTLRSTFAKVAILTYGLGTIAHVGVLFTGRPGSEMPDIAHWVVTLLAGYAGLGFVANIKRIRFVTLGDKLVYLLVLLHLLSSSMIHAFSLAFKSNDWLTIFSYSYSYFAVAYFILFGYYSFQIDRRLAES